MFKGQDEEGLMRSDGSQSVFNGVYSDKGRYQARSSTAPCYENDLGHFGTPDEAAQANGPPQGKRVVGAHVQGRKKRRRSMQADKEEEEEEEGQEEEVEEEEEEEEEEQEHGHSHNTATDTCFQCDSCNKWRRIATATAAAAAASAAQHIIPAEGEAWCCNDSGGVYTCEQPDEEGIEEEGAEAMFEGHDEEGLMRSDTNRTGFKGVHQDSTKGNRTGRYRAKCNTPPCHHNRLSTFDTSQDACMQPSRTCSTRRRTTRGCWRSSGSKDHEPHLQYCFQCRSTFSCGRTRARLDSRVFIQTRAGTRLHAPQHPAATTTSATSAPQRRQLRRTCSTIKKSMAMVLG
jgi:hypothetical protein